MAKSWGLLQLVWWAWARLKVKPVHVSAQSHGAAAQWAGSTLWFASCLSIWWIYWMCLCARDAATVYHKLGSLKPQNLTLTVLGLEGWHQMSSGPYSEACRALPCLHYISVVCQQSLVCLACRFIIPVFAFVVTWVLSLSLSLCLSLSSKDTSPRLRVYPTLLLQADLISPNTIYTDLFPDKVTFWGTED